MSHLGERITDYVFEELSAAEMAEVKSHLAACSACRKEVELFQRTHSLLKASPDVNPPRNIVFEFEKPAMNRFWKWVAPMTAAAVLLMGVALAAPLQIRWNDSQLTIAFGRLPEPAPAPPAVAPAPVVERVVAQPVDYARI
jgi:anti-sigma factor RsiW